MLNKIFALLPASQRKPGQQARKILENSAAQVYAVLSSIVQDNDLVRIAIRRLHGQVASTVGMAPTNERDRTDWLLQMAREEAFEILAAQSSINHQRNMPQSMTGPVEPGLAIFDERTVRLNMSLMSLPAHVREALINAYVYGLNYDELSLVFDVDPSDLRLSIRSNLMLLKGGA